MPGRWLEGNYLPEYLPPSLPLELEALQSQPMPQPLPLTLLVVVVVVVVGDMLVCGDERLPCFRVVGSCFG